MKETDMNITLFRACIVAVAELVNYKTCLWCKARAEPCTPPFGRCSNISCNMTQIYEILPETFSARVILMANGRMYTVHIGENIMLELAGKQITERILLTLPMLSSLTLDETTNQITAFPW